MGEISKDLVLLLQYLLPGFVATQLFYALTSHPRPSQFERVVQALVWTVIVQVLTIGASAILLWAGTHVYPFGSWTFNAQLVWSIIIAAGLGLALASLSNSDLFHRAARHLQLTLRAGHHSECETAFRVYRSTFVLLHMKDKATYQGYPKVWSSDPEHGHILLQHATWITQEGEVFPLSESDAVLINVTDVEAVEFLKLGDQLDEHKEVDAPVDPAAT